MSGRTKAYIGAAVVTVLIIGGWLVMTYHHVPVRGEVVQRFIDPESKWWYQPPPICTTINNTTTCVPQVGYWMKDDEDYVLVVADENRDGKHKAVEVERELFDRTRVGDEYVEAA